MVVLYKIVVLYYTSFYQTEIDEKTGMLVSLDDEMKKFRANSQEGSLPDAKIEAIMEAVKQIPQTDTNAILPVLHLTSSSCHPKIFVKEFSYFLMPCHQHGLRINLLVQR